LRWIFWLGRSPQEIFFRAIERCGILAPMEKLKGMCLMLAVVAYGCSAGAYTPGATLIAGLKQYEGEMRLRGSSLSRWPERQQAGGALKTVITATLGGSAEFYRLVDLDARKREYLITLRETSVRPERVEEMKNELVKMDEEIDALKPIVRAQIATMPIQGEGQQGVEGVATRGLLSLALDGFSANGARGIEAPSTKVDQYLVTDLGTFATVRSPDGQAHRCVLFGAVEEGAGIKCDAVR